MNQEARGATQDAELEVRVATATMGWDERACRSTHSRAKLYGDEHPFRPVGCDHCAGLVLDKMTDLGWSYELYADRHEDLQHARFFRSDGDDGLEEAAHAAATPVGGDARRRSICHAALAAVAGGPLMTESMPY